MPNPYFDMQIISRGKGSSAVGAASYRSGTKLRSRKFRRDGGKSAIAASAYRSGEPLFDEQEQTIYDYTGKEDVIWTALRLPDNAPDWAKSLSREALWNKVEARETRINSQLARDCIVSLPRELNRAQQIALLEDFVRQEFTSKGMIADIALHDKLASDGHSQPHGHIMLTLRELGSEGFSNKNRDWNKRAMLQSWRDAWEDCTNRHLAAAGRPERLSLKSYEERGMDRIPQEYLGPRLSKLEKRGIRTEKGDRNRWVRAQNRAREAIEGLYPELRQRDRLRSEPNDPPQSLAQIARNLNAGEGGDSRSKSQDDLTLRQRFEENVRLMLHTTNQAVTLPTRKAMQSSLQERRRMQERAAYSRYALLHSSRALSEELEDRGYAR
jgi:ATP-dependent exoDNAse (exonuclease V) alpha subunit